MTTTSGSRPSPRREAVLVALRRALAEGLWPPGSHLPAESDLAVRFRVSRPTLRQALAVLSKEGLIVTRRGQGSRVTKTNANRDRSIYLLHGLQSEAAEAVRQQLAETGAHLHLISQMAAQYDPRQEAALLERIAAEKPLGLVVAGTPWASHTERFRALLTQGVRVVHLDPPPAGDPIGEFVLPDFVGAGGCAAVELMLGGCRHLRYLAIGNSPYELELERGFSAAAQRHGGPLPQRYVIEPGLENPRSGATERMLAWLARQPAGTGLFARSLDIGCAVLRLTRRIGRQIPGDLAVISLDLQDVEDFGQPTDRLVVERTALAVRAVSALMDGTGAAVHERILPTIRRIGTVARLAL